MNELMVQIENPISLLSACKSVLIERSILFLMFLDEQTFGMLTVTDTSCEHCQDV
jgi:hypothetical protein